MQRFWPYVFCLLLSCGIGLFLGRLSCTEEISILKQWISSLNTNIENPIILCNVVQGKEECKENKVIIPQENAKNIVESSISIDGDMKQIAHVHVGSQDNVSDVSKPFCSQGDLSAKKERLQVAYHKNLERACIVLRSINHPQKRIRILARLELAQLVVAGLMGHYINELVSALLVRYCKENGELEHTELDQWVEQDIQKALAFLENELQRQQGIGQVKCIDFSRIQRRVQRNAFNKVLKSKFTSDYIPYTVY